MGGYIENRKSNFPFTIITMGFEVLKLECGRSLANTLIIELEIYFNLM
jgi:hypothetical protein